MRGRRYAGPAPRPLSKIAIIDQASIDKIAEQIEVPAANWGNIGGSLSSQTDLNNVLNSKPSLSQVKADTDIADALSKKHSPGSDNQDLSGLAPLVHTHNYEPANENIQSHVTSAHAPSNAQKNSDITKAEIEAKLIGPITSHSHTSSGGLSQQQILRMI